MCWYHTLQLGSINETFIILPVVSVIRCFRKDPNAGLSWFTNSTFGYEDVNSDGVTTLAPVADDTER